MLLFHLSIDAQSNHLTYKVVLDAGHGGKDNGTVGKHCKEKNITLAIVEKLETKLNENASINAILTRNSDVFINLDDRSSFANSNNADLFISLHCNHIHLEKVHGTEFYVMGVDTDEKHLEIVKRENHEYGEEKKLEDNDADHIMQSFYQTSYLAESLKMGQYLEQEFLSKTIIKNRGIRQAEFRVLKNSIMPGVLIEMAYLSNFNNEKYIMSEEGQNAITEAIYQAIIKYFSKSYVIPIDE